jgi:hypothetical protein
MTKENLIIVHSFPTNSILLKGLNDFLKDYFKVYLIDLPGFNTTVPPLKKINFKNYSNFVNDYINKLKLKNYYLGGISFGFSVINNCQINDKCKGFFAIEPFINVNYLKNKIVLKQFIKYQLSLITIFKIHNLVYNSKIFRFILIKFFQKIFLLKNPKYIIDIIIKTIDGYTFFKTAILILNYKDKPKFHNKPYILIINEKDKLICSAKINNLFGSLKKVLIIKTTSKHYPEKITKEYFQKHINSNNIKKIMKFIKI